MKTLFLMFTTAFVFFFAGDVLAEEMISVKLRNFIGETDQLSFRLKGDYVTFDPALKLAEEEDYTLSLKGGKLFLHYGKSKTEIASPFVLYPYEYDENHLIYLDGRPYMGAVEFQIEEGKHIRPVNQILLEDYLKGVVPFEVYPEWNIEALKAQTLAARTYTITHLDRPMDDTIHYQVYGGYNTFEKTKRAVMETQGEIITFRDNPISAFYSASNGGMTENNEHVWGGKPSPYFPIKPDPYDPILPWTFTLNKTQIALDELDWNDPSAWDELAEKDQKVTTLIHKWLNQNGYEGDIKILAIPIFEIDHEKNEAKRALEGSIQIEFMRKLIDGTILFEKVSFDHVELKKIRPMIGGIHFKSYFITSFENHPSSYKVSGHGNGHGVGMSQWGASKMADEGRTYKEIIEHYYPGTEVKVINGD